MTARAPRHCCGPLLQAAVCAVVAVGMWGCSPTTDTRGNIPLKEVVSTIERGKQNRDQIATMLGTPSTMATFGKKETWYYIGEKTETFAFFEPKLLERQILMITFDDQGMVDTVAKFDASNGKEVRLVDRVTPTKGKELGFLEQLMGNIGRFSNPDKNKR